MRNILYFVLLAVLFGSSSSFAAEQLKGKTNRLLLKPVYGEKFLREAEYLLRSISATKLPSDIELRNNSNELQHKTNSIGIKKRLEQNLPNQELKSNSEIQETGDKKIDDIFNEEDYESILAKLPDLRKTLDAEDEKMDEGVERIVNESDKISKEHYESTLPKLPDHKKISGKETLDEIDKVDIPLLKPVDDEGEEQPQDTQMYLRSIDKTELPSEIELQKKSDETSLELKPAQQITKGLTEKQNSGSPSDTGNNAVDLQKAGQKNESELSVNEVPQKKGNAPEVESQKKDTKRQEKPIVERPKEEEDKYKKLQKWSELKRGPVKEWLHKNTQSKSIYKRQYDSLNEHLPTTVFVHDYSKQLFYCIKKNNLSCLRGIISKLEKIGLSIEESLKFRNKLGDTSLIYAAKWGEIDIVRFLLLQGADLNVVNYNFQSAMDIAITKKQVSIINAIAEMTPRLVEHKRINNKEDSIMYNWAINTKENSESKCDADY